MQVVYKNNKLESICTKASVAERKYDRRMAEKIQERIDQISSFPTVEMLIRFKVGGCHALTGDRKGQFAMDLVQPYRLIFTSAAQDIRVARILEIVDYH